MEILDDQQIRRMTKRIALDIIEHHLDVGTLYIGGLNNNGMQFAELILEQIRPQQYFDTELFHVALSPSHPLKPVHYSMDIQSLHDQHIVLVDDVANTGRTMFYAFKPMLEILPASVQIAVLVDRKHKTFPIHPDYVGLSLATTMQENIIVDLSGEVLTAALQ